MDQLPVELLNYGPTGILALAMVSTIGLFWRSHRMLSSSVGHTKDALKLAEAKDERIQILVDVVKENSEAVTSLKDSVHSNSEALDGLKDSIRGMSEVVRHLNRRVNG